ncbi:MAG TPA: hypothetical protein VFM38_04280 [Candidatus Limnocylindrales bacterium]|nr:hypothetical protein [Candidatus Limnocylindrales bacterium]
MLVVDPDDVSDCQSIAGFADTERVGRVDADGRTDECSLGDRHASAVNGSVLSAAGPGVADRDPADRAAVRRGTHR